MSGILLAVFATAILNNLILYFWKPWLGAYGAEKAKNLARKEDLDKVLSEVRAVTAIQKQKEAQLSGREWNCQILWNRRFDVYSSAMSVISELEASTIQLKNLKPEFGVVDPRDHQLALDQIRS